MIILGIDPGTATTGFGVIESAKTLKCLDFGCIKTSPSLKKGQRLQVLQSGLKKILKKYKPDAVAVEDIFFFKNLKTAIAVAEARGVILLTIASEKVSTQGYTPLQIKQTVTSYGRAQKSQVQKMVKIILNMKDLPQPDDAADALACAICRAYDRTAGHIER